MSDINKSTVLHALRNHIGQDAGIEIESLVWETCRREPTQSRQRLAREIVSELRREGHHICAHPNHGYFIAANDKELDDTCRFLTDRAITSLAQVAAMRRVSMPDLYGQMNLLKEI